MMIEGSRMAQDFPQNGAPDADGGFTPHFGDHERTGLELAEMYGDAALREAIDRQVDARSRADDEGFRFWGRVCGTIVLIRTTRAVGTRAGA
jgi:hypothetical protein